MSRAIAFFSACLAFGWGGVFLLLLQTLRQNGRLLRRIDTLEDATVRGLEQIAQQERQLFLMAHPWLRLRPGTYDASVVYEIVATNDYRLPPSYSQGDVIIDVGAHIGVFAIAVLDRGCGRVLCFEPEPENAALARSHLSPYGDRAEVIEAAVWRSDRPATGLHYQPYADDPENLGGGDVLHPAGVPVAAVSLDDVILEATNGGHGRIRLLKLDCEGSEYAILLTSAYLYLVDEIVGEHHTVPEGLAATAGIGAPSTVEALAAHLTANGFEVEVTMTEGGSNAGGMFFARRTSTVASE